MKCHNIMQKLTDKHYEDLMDVLDAIEFQKIHKVMNYLDWWWVNAEGDKMDSEVPDIHALRKTARRLLTEACNKALNNESGQFTVGTGGFRAEAKLYEDGFLWMRLSFDLTDGDNSL